MNEIQLPDYLPSRYKSWLHLYTEVQKIYSQRNEQINEETTIKLYELGDSEDKEKLLGYSEKEIHFYQHFPITLIKARALDDVFAKLPSFDEMYVVRNKALSSPNADESVYKFFDKLFSVLPKSSH